MIRLAALLVSLGAGLLLLVTQEAAAASHNVTIASFNYTPFDVRIAVGDTVTWRNADPTVHTVTASRGEFSSGSMRQGQLYSATFNVPGLYPYFCEPHEEMRGTVSVVGPAPPTTTTTATTLAVATTVAPLVNTTTTSAPAATTVDTTTPNAPPTSVVAPVRAVVASGVTGSAEQPSPIVPMVIVVALSAMGVVVLLRAGVGRSDALRYVAAAATAATGLLHVQLRIALDYPEPIGTLLVIEAAGAALLAVWLIARPWNRAMQLTAIGAHAGALGALAITRTGVGLFGFHEIGWDPSPQVPLALTFGVVALTVLSATPVDRYLQRQ